MIKVDDVNKVKDLGTSKTRKASGGESFSAYLSETMKPKSAPVGGSVGINIADGVLAAQMVNGEEEKERRKLLVKRGQTLLEKLEEIRDGLLMGYISRDRLIEISRPLKDNRYQSDDPRLQHILSGIELRVDVDFSLLLM